MGSGRRPLPVNMDKLVSIQMGLVHSIGRKIASVIRLGASRANSARLSCAVTYMDYKLHQRRLNPAPRVSGAAQPYLDELHKCGICVIEGFWDADKCDQALSEIERLIETYPHYIHPDPKADKRIFGANNASGIIAEFNDHPLLAEIATAYTQEPTRAVFTLAAKLPMTPNNLGSGEGWHRDEPVRRFKAILYLVDVGMDNGPFQMIKNSHPLKNILSDTLTAKLKYPQFRVSDQQIEKILDQDNSRLTTYPAKAGTLILADVSSIHRGMPIRSGTRYALTAYYFSADKKDAELYEKFKAIPIMDK
jgi:Phytanoyl-CoA dioxygenase (PhyH)